MFSLLSARCYLVQLEGSPSSCLLFEPADSSALFANIYLVPWSCQIGQLTATLSAAKIGSFTMTNSIGDALSGHKHWVSCKIDITELFDTAHDTRAAEITDWLTAYR